MSHEPALGKEGSRVWNQLVHDQAALGDSKTFRESLLDEFASIPGYVTRYRFSRSQWLTSPMRCLRFVRLQRRLHQATSYPSQLKQALRLDSLLSKIEFGWRGLKEQEKFHIRRSAGLHMLAGDEIRLAITAAGLYRRDGRLALLRQPTLVYWLGKATRDLSGILSLLLFLFASVHCIAIGCIDCSGLGIYFLSLILLWSSTLAHMVGPQWRNAQQLRDKIFPALTIQEGMKPAS